jgi:hypothetical protein
VDELTLKVLLAELGPALAGATASSSYRLRPGVIVLELKTRDVPRGAFTLAPGDGGATFYDADPGKRRGERVRVRTGLEGAELAAAAQWSDDRLAVFDFAVGGVRRRLAAEFFGRAGGLFILEDDAVVAALIGRPLAKGEEYPWPGDRGRAPAGDLSAGDIAAYRGPRGRSSVTATPRPRPGGSAYSPGPRRATTYGR